MRPSALRKLFRGGRHADRAAGLAGPCASSTGTARPCRGDRKTRMKLIGIDEHYLTGGPARRPGARSGCQLRTPGVIVHSGEVEWRLLDLVGERLAPVDETDLDVQVLSDYPCVAPCRARRPGTPCERCRSRNRRSMARAPSGAGHAAGSDAGGGGGGAGPLRPDAWAQGNHALRPGRRSKPRPLGLLRIFKSAAALQVRVLLHPRAPTMAVQHRLLQSL
jgi:hypothetical protein